MLVNSLLRTFGIIYHIQKPLFYVYIKYFKCWRLICKIGLILYLNHEWEQSKKKSNKLIKHIKKDPRLIIGEDFHLK